LDPVLSTARCRDGRRVHISLFALSLSRNPLRFPVSLIDKFLYSQISYDQRSSKRTRSREMTTTTSTATLPKAGTYAVDPAHTEVGFVARHLIGTKVRGRFTEASGTFTVAENPEESSLEAVVQAASIHTNQSQRDDHLRTNDFLDVPNHPTLTLKSTGFKHVDGGNWVMTADLTIRGVTESVDFDLEYLGEGPSMQEGNTVVAFSAT